MLPFGHMSYNLLNISQFILQCSHEKLYNYKQHVFAIRDCVIQDGSKRAPRLHLAGISADSFNA